jgi:STE24 endopeptidase
VAQGRDQRGGRLSGPSPPDAAAWLARIPESQRLAAHAATDWRLAAWAVGGLALLGACVLLSQAGVVARLRRGLEAERPRPWLVAAASACVLALVLAPLKAVIDAVAAWRGEQILGLGGSSLVAHLTQDLAGVAPAVLGAALLVPGVLWLMRRLPRTWPLLLGSLMTGLIVAAVWLPYALSAGPPMTPAPAGPVRDGLLRLIADTGLPAHDVFFSTEPTFDADVTGGFGQARVSMGPLIAAGPPAEARAFIGHIMGHYVHNDILIVSLVLGAAMLLGCFAVSWLAAPLARRIGALGVAGPSDPEALPAVAIVVMLALVGAGLAEAGYLRWANVRADAYSLDHAHEPDALISVIEREWDHQSLDPSPIEEALFYTHPAMTGRIRHALAWEAAHGG